jgi:hypothetical protein
VLNQRAAALAAGRRYANQVAARRAHDTRDADGDGLYCESLRCPCANRNPGRRPPARWPDSWDHSWVHAARGVVPIGLSGAEYPHMQAHVQRARRRGWPRVLVVTRGGRAC